MSRTLVTGAAGFIGMHTSRMLLEGGGSVVGLDNLNDYYAPELKRDRLGLLSGHAEFRFEEAGLEDCDAMSRIFHEHQFDRVIHLAAQAGVRYSLENPHAYIDSNLVGFMNILEECRRHEIGHLVYASSSSVYGANRSIPFHVDDRVDHPVSLYAATKKSNELMAHCYSHLFGIPTTGLRFFTVYGPWGRPDMATWLFTEAILNGRPINVFNHGKMKRDFTYVDDIVQGVVRVSDLVPTPGEDQPTSAPYRLFNIGNNEPVELMRLISCIEECLGLEARKIMQPMQPGDVPVTYADVDALQDAVGFRPSTPIETGVRHFVDWYRNYHNV